LGEGLEIMDELPFPFLPAGRRGVPLSTLALFDLVQL
jgi:hypothetical protein